MGAAEFVGKGPVGPHLLLDFVNVVEIISERGMYVGEGQRGHMRDNIVRTHALMFGPDDDVQNAHTMACMRALPPQTPGVLTIRSVEDAAMRRV